MMKHYFPLKKYQPFQTQLRVLTLRSNPGVQTGLLQQRDVTAAPRAHTSDVTFSKFNFSQPVMNGIL